MTPTRILFNYLYRRGRLGCSWLRLALWILFVLLSLDFIMLTTINPPPVRVSPSSPFLSTTHKDRIFIASMHWNNELILRSHWNAAVLDLVRHFGAENVYVSIVESGSWDDTKGALRDLDMELDKLGVERSIELLEKTHAEEIGRVPEPLEEGWIWTSRGKKEVRRIPYLAGIRNRVMSKLEKAGDSTNGQEKRPFDKILWLNDIIFTTEDVTTLIATRNGNYAAACALDFSSPPLYYDTFALRDISGAKAITQTWPYFLAAASRDAIISNMPVPVKSCWNGLVVFQADSFTKDPPAIDFRGLPDSLAMHHLEGSECCLIHADNELSTKYGVWLNPNVRVSYNPDANKLVNSENGIWPSRRERVEGIWANRWARWIGFPQRYIERYVVERRIRSWLHENHREETRLKDAHCMINEMQVLVENGWAHV